MSSPIGKSDWILCASGLGYAYSHGERSAIHSHFPKNSVAIAQEEFNIELLVYLPGLDREFIVARNETAPINVHETGKGFDHLICNICFVLKPEDEFQINQTDAYGRKTRRPSCRICRLDIDGQKMSSRERKAAQAAKPPKGSLWKCPICRKMGIVGVNVRVVIDHDHYAGRKRGYLCDSCNTGLGRFKNGEDFLRNAIAYLKANEFKE